MMKTVLSLGVVVMTTNEAISDDKAGIMTPINCQCYNMNLQLCLVV